MRKIIFITLITFVILQCASDDEVRTSKNEEVSTSNETKKAKDSLESLKDDFNLIDKKIKEMPKDNEKAIRMNGIVVSLFSHKLETSINENVQVKTPESNKLLGKAIEMKEITDTRILISEFIKRRNTIEDLLDKTIASSKIAQEKK